MKKSNTDPDKSINVIPMHPQQPPVLATDMQISDVRLPPLEPAKNPDHAKVLTNNRTHFIYNPLFWILTISAPCKIAGTAWGK